jgi:signal transduction histidine kinase
MVIRSLPMRVNLISLASLIAMSLILGISGASVVGANERRFSFSRAQLAASEIAEGMERFLAGGGAIEDFLGFDEAWSSARGQDGSLGGAALFDARGNMLFSDGRVDAAWVPEPAHLVPGSRERAGGSRAAHPVLSAEGGIVGYAVVAVDEGALRRIGGGIVSVMALMSLSLVAGTAVIQGLLFRRGIGIPLRRLVATADSLASGDIGKLPDLERYAGQSDVGRIYAAFARLVGRLLEAQADLVEQNKALDETVRKRTGMLEGAYAELAADLERRAALEGELVAAKEGAEAANKAKGAFLAAMSHEIRTPMNSILGYLEFLSRGKLGEEERDYITIVESNARHLLALIDDILDFSKIESGRLELADEVFDPAQVFARSARMLEPKAAEKGVALSISAESGFGCRGDGLRLGQVVVNLVGNAVKFTDEGGRVEAALGAAREPGGVRLSASVADTGIGIERDKIGRIFGAFSQADAMIAGRYGGTGLGLAISAWIV